ncbi:hypothetical protein P692DRAFT_20842421 [Suillus brevipes Sb2]|nr:hypothetical protein P692DRAFT_20842421 [Suillus brevipes Sb2]
MAHFLNNVLESQDEEWHENSPEWKRKMAQAAVKAGPGDSCQRASISYLLVLRLNHQRLKYKTKREWSVADDLKRIFSPNRPKDSG